LGGKAKKKTRAKTARAQTRVRRARIAARVLDGASTAAIAREEGIIPRAVVRHLHSPEVEAEIQLRVAKVIDLRAQRVVQLFDRALTTLEQGMEAERTVSVVIENPEKDGPRRERITEPDHHARIAAVNSLAKVAMLGRPQPLPVKDADEGPLTWTVDHIRALIGFFQEVVNGNGPGPGGPRGAHTPAPPAGADVRAAGAQATPRLRRPRAA